MYGKLSGDYTADTEMLDNILRTDKNFDIIRRRLCIGSGSVTLWFIDGFVKDAIMQRLMQFMLDKTGLPGGSGAAQTFADTCVPYVETDVCGNVDTLVTMLLSGASVLLGSSFGAEGLIIDARTYPARTTEEPESDKVIRGARDGFVETLIFNTALVRRRIRDPRLTVSYHSVGSSSKTDVAVVYIEGRAEKKYTEKIEKLIDGIDTDALSLGHESLTECLIKKRWYNPFPKVRTTERPDAACAQLLEGSIIILVDNSPEAMLLPTAIFDFLQESDDYYMPPLTGCYLRILRIVVFFLTLVLTPLWYLAVQNPGALPPWLLFIVPEKPGEIPLVFQLLLVEFIIDVLKLASLNTPSVFTNSLSVVAGLILGDFAVDVGLLTGEVILYMAFVSIANFTQPSFELGFAAKFLRMMLLILSALFGIWGFFAGLVLIIVLLALNKTVCGGSYLYPLIPFSGRALLRQLFRVKKGSEK